MASLPPGAVPAPTTPRDTLVNAKTTLGKAGKAARVVSRGEPGTTGAAGCGHHRGGSRSPPLLGSQALWVFTAPSSGQASSTLCSRPPLGRPPIMDMAPSAPDLSPADMLRLCPFHTVPAGSRLSHAHWPWVASPAPQGGHAGQHGRQGHLLLPTCPSLSLPLSVSLPLHADARLGPALTISQPVQVAHGLSL